MYGEPAFTFCATGDCWLLSAISSMAEFDGAVHKMFEKTGADVTSLPAGAKTPPNVPS